MSCSLSAVGGHDHVLSVDISVKYFKRASFSSALSSFAKREKQVAQYGGDGQWVLDILHSWGCRLELRVALLAQGTRVFGFDVQNEKNKKTGNPKAAPDSFLCVPQGDSIDRN